MLLISSDFLASEYCWSTEVRRAMERHPAKDAVVIPVILRPCEWTRAPFGKLLAAPLDGKAVTGWSDRDAAFLDVARQVRAAVNERLKRSPQPAPAAKWTEPPTTNATQRSAQVRSSNLAVAKRFTQADEDEFLLKAFEFLTEFFEGSLFALKDRNPDIVTRYRRIDANRFTAAAYRDGRKEAACTIWIGGEAFGSGINFFANDSGESTAMNDGLRVQKNDHGLFFKALMGAFDRGGDGDRNLTVEQACERLWGKFLEPMQSR